MQSILHRILYSLLEKVRMTCMEMVNLIKAQVQMSISESKKWWLFSKVGRYHILKISPQEDKKIVQTLHHSQMPLFQTTIERSNYWEVSHLLKKKIIWCNYTIPTNSNRRKKTRFLELLRKMNRKKTWWLTKEMMFTLPKVAVYFRFPSQLAPNPNLHSEGVVEMLMSRMILRIRF